MNKKILIFAIITLGIFGMAGFVVPVSSMAVDYSTVNQAIMWGDSSTAWNIYNTLYETDEDVLSLITGNELSLWSDKVTIQGQAVDYTETSFGKTTTDWTGTVGSTTDTAYGGVNYWLPNATSSPKTTSTGNAQVVSSMTLASPSASGYKGTATITFDDETTENADVDGSGRNFVFGTVGDFSGVDVELNANSYVLMNYAFQFSVLNTTAISRIGIYFVIRTNGGNDVSVIVSYMSGTTTNTAFEDSTTSASESLCIDTTDEDVVYWDINATSTSAYEFVKYYKVDDLLSKSAAYTSESPAQLKEWGYFAMSKYSSASSGGVVGTITAKNLLFVDNIEDLCLWEQTDLNDDSTQQSNNFPNATSVTISTEDEYQITDGFDFAVDSNIPINRLTLSAYTLMYESETSVHVAYDKDNNIMKRTDTFDTNPKTDERVTDPTTFYLNMSSLNANYELNNVYKTTIDTDNAYFDTNGNLRSGYTLVDKDSSPSLNEISDIYDNLADVDGDLQFGHTSLNTVSDAHIIIFIYDVLSTDWAGLSVGGTGNFILIMDTALNYVSIIALGSGIIFGGGYLFITGRILGTKRDDRASRRKSKDFKFGWLVITVLIWLVFLFSILLDVLVY